MELNKSEATVARLDVAALCEGLEGPLSQSARPYSLLLSPQSPQPAVGCSGCAVGTFTSTLT